LATSKRGSVRPLYVYMQRPDTAQWLTVGAYWRDEAASAGRFMYAPSYEAAGHPWAIDPVNLAHSAQPSRVYTATRYLGLHDVLRDACPDSWGQALLRKSHGLPDGTPMLRYLKVASNADRWGALAVGPSAKPSIAMLATPRLPTLGQVVRELQAMAAFKPATDPALRTRLEQTPSLGGARPKASVQDHHGQYWLVKPLTLHDSANIPMLEHFAQSWGAHSGMRFASTQYHDVSHGHIAVRVLRFDRYRTQRTLCVSAASLLEAEFPAAFNQDGHSAKASYPRLASQLRLIGSPACDRIELFERMVFNAVCGNDDDHLRNHAVYYDHATHSWRLSPAFDVVPNAGPTPTHLAMAVGLEQKFISQKTVLHDALQFGFESHSQASIHLKLFLERVRDGFDATRHLLDEPLRSWMAKRMADNLRLLGAG
jgi:serine/threonine-protein kinase HipA